MKKQPEITDATREAFVSAFFQLAQKKSIHQITVRELATLAGYNRTTFYRYFEDVFALVEYAEDEFIKSTREALREQYPDDSFRANQFFEIVIKCFHEDKERVSILMSDQNRSHFLRRIEENVTNNVYISSNDSPKKRIVRDIYFYGIFHAISLNLQSENSLSDEDLLDVIETMFTKWYRPAMTQND